MNRSKIVAIITGAISLLLAIAYLLLVQLLDFRGEMVPAPLSTLPNIFKILILTHPVFNGTTL
ncbi:MAG: glucose-inhibited division protein A [Leptolyngbya sp. SIO3F4]|nr:glucose-inhibited division protein A [Leptolyngbya sp. SIO3F4]